MEETREIYALELIREAFQLGVAFVHLPTLKPVRFKTYASIRKSLTGPVYQGTSLAIMANHMRSECRRMRERMIPAPSLETGGPGGSRRSPGS